MRRPPPRVSSPVMPWQTGPEARPSIGLLAIAIAAAIAGGCGGSAAAGSAASSATSTSPATTSTSPSPATTAVDTRQQAHAFLNLFSVMAERLSEPATTETAAIRAYKADPTPHQLAHTGKTIRFVAFEVRETLSNLANMTPPPALRHAWSPFLQNLRTTAVRLGAAARLARRGDAAAFEAGLGRIDTRGTLRFKHALLALLRRNHIHAPPWLNSMQPVG